MATVFFYARPGGAPGLTDLEFYRSMFGDQHASFADSALYLGLFFNCMIMAAVNLAAVKIANVVLGWPMVRTLVVCSMLNIAFAATSGLWGVMVTDLIQFGIAMTGSFAAAYFAVRQPVVGGLEGLFEKAPARMLGFLPDFGDWKLTLSLLVIPLTVQWWSVWYPGADPGGELHRSACSRRRVSATHCQAPCFSMSRTMRSVHGRGRTGVDDRAESQRYRRRFRTSIGT
jgi:hypothetical protein